MGTMPGGQSDYSGAIPYQRANRPARSTVCAGRHLRSTMV